MDIKSHRFIELSEKALADDLLQKSINRAGGGLLTNRNIAFSTVDDPEALFDRAKEIKQRAVAHLPQLIETLEAKVKELGGVVHWARTGKEANRIISDLAREKNVKTIVKGKSMVSEETGLTEVLEKDGYDVFETDLGEFIIQLAGEPPSHIVGPALHKTKEEISQLFCDKLGCPNTDNPEELTRYAREALREKFVNADMGISGANMAIAETGSVVLVENEGNIRLSMTVPRIHVALVGIEKVIPTLDDMAVLLNVLARSATGQKLSVYTSIITGPRREGEIDGPEEFHLVLLDNGRSRILADPERREILRCIRCGACLNICPVYHKVGGHTYGWVYSGPMGAVLTPQFLSPRIARDLPFASTLCGACKEVCPVRIDLPKLLIYLRTKLAEDPTWDAGLPVVKRIATSVIGLVISNPRLYRLATAGMRLAQKIFAPTGRWPFLPPEIARWGKNREIPMPKKPFSQRWNSVRENIKRETNRS